MGYTGSGLSLEKFKEGFEKTVSRGPDMSRVCPLPFGGFLGFHRLAIMGMEESGMQPFTLDGDAVVCNGEIYGFRPLKEALAAKGYSVPLRLRLRDSAAALSGIRCGDVRYARRGICHDFVRCET